MHHRIVNASPLNRRHQAVSMVTKLTVCVIWRRPAEDVQQAQTGVIDK